MSRSRSPRGSASRCSAATARENRASSASLPACFTPPERPWGSVAGPPPAAVPEHADRGAALLVVTHDLAFAAETLQRGIVLDRGRLACDEPLDRLLTSAERLKPLGLVPPPVAALSVALDLPGRPVRERDAAHTLARVAGGRSAS